MDSRLASVSLPLKCDVSYFENFISPTVSKELYQLFQHDYQIQASKLSWKIGDENIESDFSKIIFTDQELIHKNVFEASIWGNSYVWPAALLPVKEAIEDITKKEFRVCVCIYYPDGTSGVDFHSDFVAFGDTSVIPSLSLGAERTFQLRERATQEVYSKLLHEGSLVVMGDQCQELYEHALPLDPKCKSGRINLTFRQYGL